MPALTSAGACNMLATQAGLAMCDYANQIRRLMSEEIYQWKGHLFSGGKKKKIAMLLFI